MNKNIIQFLLIFTIVISIYIVTGLENKHQDISNKPTVIVAFGDSITYGNSTENQGFT